MGNLIGYSHETLETLKSRCTYVYSLPFNERCEFVDKLDCDGDAKLIKYHELIFCKIPADKAYIYYITVVLMFIFFLLLFYYLAVTVDQFFCPAIGVISDILRLSENLSGVTLLALGNGLPDIISSLISSSGGETILMYNQLLGGSMFVTCFVAGFIAYSRPFHFEIFPFLRDMICTMITVSIIVHINNKHVPKYGCFVFFGIYCSYICIAIGYFFYKKRIEARQKSEEYVDWTELRRPCIINESDVEEIISQIRKKHLADPEEEKKNAESYCKELWNDLKAFSKDEWRVMKCWQRFLIILQSPVLIVLRLIIPNVCFGSPRNGWCKILNTINVVLYPIFIGFALNLNYYIFGISTFFIYILLGILCGILVILTSEKHVQPPYHFVFAFLNLGASIIVIYQLVNEIVSILNSFGTILGIQSQVLVITALAWGNGLGDAVTNITLAKHGFQRMAFSGCLAGSITTMCLSFGLSLSSADEASILIRSGCMGPVCTLFIMVNLVYSFLFMLLTNFKARKSYGLFLILVYVEFLTFCILSELHIIHPIGSSQNPDEFHELKKNST